MSKIITAILALAFCSTAFAESVLYVCERPAWDGEKGCGPNNTYATYNLLVDTRDFNSTTKKYEFRTRKGCDASKGRRYQYKYQVNDEAIMFLFKTDSASMGVSKTSTITMDRSSMKAVLSHVKDSPELICRIEEG